MTSTPLSGRTALVAGATRGAGRAVAVELARAGAHVYVTGRSSRASGAPSSTAPRRSRRPATWSRRRAPGPRSWWTTRTPTPSRPWCADRGGARRARRAGQRHVRRRPLCRVGQAVVGAQPRRRPADAEDGRLVPPGHRAPRAAPGAADRGVDRPAGARRRDDRRHRAANADFRRGVGFYYDLVKANVSRIVTGLAAELEEHPVTTVGVTPGWLRSEAMLDNFGVTEETWRDACAETPPFAISESPTYVAGRRRPRLVRCGRALGRRGGQRPPAGRRLRRHRRGRLEAGRVGTSGPLRLGPRRRRGHRRLPIAPGWRSGAWPGDDLRPFAAPGCRGRVVP